MAKKYNTYFQCMNLGNVIYKVPVKGIPYPITGSKYNFFLHENKVSNVETGFGITVKDNLENPPSWFTVDALDKSVERVLSIIGNIVDVPTKEEGGKIVETLISKYGEQFKSIFGTSIDKFYEPVTGGFDIIRFNDVFIKPPDEKSLQDVVLERYGQAACDLIHEMNGYCGIWC